MSGDPTDVTSWHLVDPALMIARLRNERSRPKVGTWIIHKGISPLDLYVYLRARFGNPNGFAITLKHPSSDNLIHWNWTLQSGSSVIELLGYQLQVLVAIDDTDDPSQVEVSALVANLKADFASHGKAMATVKKSLEKWFVFTNPYHRLRRVVTDMSKRLQTLNINHQSLPGLPKTPEDLDEFRTQQSGLGSGLGSDPEFSFTTNYIDCFGEDSFGSCLANDPLFPYMAALSPLPLANLKSPGERLLPGSSPWTTIDRRLPAWMRPDPKGGFPVVRGNIGRIKYVGRYGTAALVVGTFSTSYSLTAVARCW